MESNAADELSTQKQRTRTASTLAARVGSDKAIHRERLSSVSSMAASLGRDRLLSATAQDNRRRMSVLAAEAAAEVEDPDAHEDNASKSHVVAPAWQEEGRTRGKSVAAEVADLVSFKMNARVRGKSVADEAVKSAIFQGLATHDGHDGRA